MTNVQAILKTATTSHFCELHLKSCHVPIGGSNQNTNRFAALSGSDQGQRQQRFGQQNQQQPSNFGNRPSNQ